VRQGANEGMNVLGAVLLAVLALAALQGAWRLAAVRRARRLRGQVLPDDPLLDPWRDRDAALIYFHSPRCSACRRMAPRVQRLADAGHPLLQVDVTRHPDTARALGVLATPTTVVVRNGRVAGTLIGSRSESALAEALAAAAPS